MGRALKQHTHHHHHQGDTGLGQGDHHTFNQNCSNTFMNCFHPDFYHHIHDHVSNDHQRPEKPERNFDRVGHGSPDMGIPNVVHVL